MPAITPDALLMTRPGGNPLALKLTAVPSGSLAANANDALEFNVVL